MRSGSPAKLEASSSVAASPPTTDPLISPLEQEFEADKRNALAALAVFLAAYAIALMPNAFDLPLERLINSYANKSVAIDHLFFDLDTYFIFSGVPVLALIWGEWSADKERRARLILGIFAVLCAGLLSRSLQHLLATHPRPFYDPALGFHLPSMLSETPLATWNSFPSDHAAVFFGLAALIASIRPRLGVLVFLWLAVVESARAYVGAHYPSDLIGGAALGASLVWLVQVPGVMRRVAGKMAGWARLSPFLFYTGAFLLSYQVATLFADLRYLSGGFALIGNLRRLL